MNNEKASKILENALSFSATEFKTRNDLEKFTAIMSMAVKELDDAIDTLKWVHGAAFFAARFILLCDAEELINKYENLYASLGAFHAEAVRQSRLERGQTKSTDAEAMVN